MFGTIARVALLRVLPRRLVPLLTAWQVIRMVRGRRNRNTDPATVSDTSRRAASRRR